MASSTVSAGRATAHARSPTNSTTSCCLFSAASTNHRPRESINRFLIDLSLVCEVVFDYLVEEVADRDLFDNTYQIDSTDVRADPADDDATWNHDPMTDSDDNDGDDGTRNQGMNKKRTLTRRTKSMTTAASTMVMAI